MRKFHILALPLAALSLTLAASGNEPESPEYIPSCSYPQPGAPAQLAGGVNVPSITATAWNGQEYGTFYHDRADLRYYFRRIYADGTPASAPVFIANSGNVYRLRTALVWTGTEYGAAWASIDAGGWLQIFFSRLNRNGGFVSGPLRVSNVGLPLVNHADTPSLAWSGSGYAVLWEDARNNATTLYDIYATLLDASGNIAGGGALRDLLINNSVENDFTPVVAWSPAAGSYLYVWERWNVSYSAAHLFRGRLTPAGAITLLTQVDTSTGFAAQATLAGDGNGFAVSWLDSRDLNNELYGVRLNGWGTSVGAEVRLTTSAENENFPVLAWTGSEYGLFYSISPSFQVNDIWHTRLSATLGVLNSPLQLTSSGNAGYPRAAFGRYGYLLTYNDYVNNSTTGPNHSLPVTCNYAYAPPCPGNPAAYNLSGTAATLSWQGVDDGITDIAYYRAYRNNAAVGSTSDTYFSDSGLALNTSYNYTFRAVNAAQSQSPPNCPAIYVRTNATLTLTMNKASLDAGLNWTDAGFNDYFVFRGTSPQVMGQIGTTPALSTTDPNVLADTTSYFYSVDNPAP